MIQNKLKRFKKVKNNVLNDVILEQWCYTWSIQIKNSRKYFHILKQFVIDEQMRETCLNISIYMKL